MKLYTEEQVKKIYLKGWMDGESDRYSNDGLIEAINDLTPIELPSDEELKKQFDVDEFDPYDLAYLGGAIRMRNLIQGGNK